MRSMTLLVCFFIAMFMSIQGCQYINEPDAGSNTGSDNPEWKGAGSTMLAYNEYSVHSTSNYAVYGELNKTFFACIKDSASFNQYFTYTPQSWDSTIISPSIFSYRQGILISDRWMNIRAGYFTEGVYLFGKKIYIDYRKEIYPVSNVSAVHNSFLFIVVNKNSADSIIVVENKSEVAAFAAGSF